MGDNRDRRTQLGDERGEVVDHRVEADEAQGHRRAQRSTLVEVHDRVVALDVCEGIEQVAVVVTRTTVDGEHGGAGASLQHVEVMVAVADR